MTLIAYRDGVMAADSACWGAGSLVVVGHVQKIRRLGDMGTLPASWRGGLLACAGESGHISAFRGFVDEGCLVANRPPPASEHDFEALLVCKDGTVVRWSAGWLPFEVHAPYHAMGRGDAFMLGAMAAGASAEQAVRLALEHTDGGGGSVQVERVRMPAGAPDERGT